MVRARLAQKGARALGIPLQKRMLGQLAQIVRGDSTPLLLYGRRQLAEDLERIGPIALALVNPHQMVEGCVAVLARGRKLLEQSLGAVHESGAEVIESEGERRFVTQSGVARGLQA